MANQTGPYSTSVNQSVILSLLSALDKPSTRRLCCCASLHVCLQNVRSDLPCIPSKHKKHKNDVFFTNLSPCLTLNFYAIQIYFTWRSRYIPPPAKPDEHTVIIPVHHEAPVYKFNYSLSKETETILVHKLGNRELLEDNNVGLSVHLYMCLCMLAYVHVSVKLHETVRL